MTERKRSYRQRMEDKGLVQVRIWIEKQDEEEADANLKQTKYIWLNI